MVGAELGDEVGGVFGGVDGEGAGDDEEGLGEFADGELFAGALSRWEVRSDCTWGVRGLRGRRGETYNCHGEFFEVDMQCRLYSTTSGNDATAFKGAFYGRQRVVY